jgi:hypothetical protein
MAGKIQLISHEPCTSRERERDDILSPEFICYEIKFRQERDRVREGDKEDRTNMMHSTLANYFMRARDQQVKKKAKRKAKISVYILVAAREGKWRRPSPSMQTDNHSWHPPSLFLSLSFSLSLSLSLTLSLSSSSPVI